MPNVLWPNWSAFILEFSSMLYPLISSSVFATGHLKPHGNVCVHTTFDSLHMSATIWHRCQTQTRFSLVATQAGQADCGLSLRSHSCVGLNVTTVWSKNQGYKIKWHYRTYISYVCFFAFYMTLRIGYFFTIHSLSSEKTKKMKYTYLNFEIFVR